jgi:hypothetical protein
MSALADVLAYVPVATASVTQRIAAVEASAAPPEQRAWRLWLEARWAMNAGAFWLAHAALDAVLRVTPDIPLPGRPVLQWETAGLRGKLFHNEGELNRAYPELIQALEHWLSLFSGAAHSGGQDLIIAALGSDQGAPELWLDHLRDEAIEVFTRAIRVTSRVKGYPAACRLAETDFWPAELWPRLRSNAAVRLALTSAANDGHRFTPALVQSVRGLTIMLRLPPGPEHDQLTAGFRAERGRTFLGLGRESDAVREYDAAAAGFRSVGATVEATVASFTARFARAVAGTPIGSAELAQAVATLEPLAPMSVGAARTLELARHWLLSQLAREGTEDLETVIDLIEVLHAGRPHHRAAMTHPDPVVARVTRPFAILGERLRKLPGTVLVTMEPDVEGLGRSPVYLVVSAESWHLVRSEGSQEAVGELERRAETEHQALLTGELLPHTPPSASLVEAAEAAWRALPAEVREAIRAAHTVIYLPSSNGSVAGFPFELLRPEHGWLGTTHVVARCPSLQYLEEILAPNARRPVPDLRLVVATPAPHPDLGLLDDAEEEADLVTRAAVLLGRAPEHTLLADRDTALEAFTHRAAVHYIGHGVANPIEELLPLSSGAVLNALELPIGQGTGAPFVFFSACRLGRVRHVAGGRQRGWALQLLERGSPAVIGALQPVPDSAAIRVARAFYTAARKMPVGEAMLNARTRLNQAGMHPLLWAAYVLYGDPFAGLAAQAPGSAAALVSGWPDAATRFLATGRPEEAPARAASDPEEKLAAAAADLLDRDPEGAATCRILLAAARLTRQPDDPAELDVAYLCADVLQDGYAILYLLANHADAIARHRPGAQDLLGHTAQGWLSALPGDRAALAHLIEHLPT